MFQLILGYMVSLRPAYAPQRRKITQSHFNYAQGRGDSWGFERDTVPGFCLLSDSLSSAHTFFFGKLWAYFKKEKKIQGCVILPILIGAEKSKTKAQEMVGGLWF